MYGNLPYTGAGLMVGSMFISQFQMILIAVAAVLLEWANQIGMAPRQDH